MGILVTVLTILDVLVAILIIALVLVQQSKSGGGLGTTFGGGGSDSLFGAHASTHLTKLTTFFATIFVLVTLALAIITGRNYGATGANAQLNNLLEQKQTTGVASATSTTATKAIHKPIPSEAVHKQVPPSPVKSKKE